MSKHNKRFPTTFQGLTKVLEPRPIHNERQYRKIQVMVDDLAGHQLNGAQEAYLETLTILMEVYESEHHAISNSELTLCEILRFLMDQHDMNASDLGRALGDRSAGSRVLRGERDLSKQQMRRLAEQFNVQPGLFLRPQPAADSGS